MDRDVCLIHRLCQSLCSHFPHRDAFYTFANISGSTLFAYGSMIRYDPTLRLVDLTKTFIYTIIHSWWSLALLFMKEKAEADDTT